jgi:ATP-dependent Clp protease ATP-binding subunit ClpX
VIKWTENVSCRSAGDTSESDSCTSDTDMVELEKSNILVMGPTGSGTCFDPLVCYIEL